jgi:predicted PurR-regulated permease PerM
MSEKQVSEKKLAFVLILCIILATSLVAVIAFYSSVLNTQQNSIDSLNDIVTDKNDEIALLNSTQKDLQDQITNMTSSIVDYQKQIGNLIDIIELRKTEEWINDYFDNVSAGTYMIWNRTIEYAGYIRFDRLGGGSTTETGEIYAQVTWISNNGVVYDQKKVYGVDNQFRFPILPTSNLEVKVGYDDPENGTAHIIVAISIIY